ncbi:hypothetical protein Cch01nite_00170 [Cellulomonas chitinilytica]|uniref:Uncharacterized protein n=1 Tax=Cellulomonas chitinilytica TaxID=398759 RepID=A0A919NXA2_9CELL|nr:PQ-loop repeat-containing protein [Cellulomonas chitinilytica]GIG19293.1 hypothetical protein Cch01nite_00170 [Cellulomonas chitinilytica]
MTSATALGLVCVALSACGTVPQLVRLRATGAVAGVSVAALLNSLVSAVAWGVYGVHLGDPWVVAQSVGALVPGVATVLVAWPGAGRRGLHLPVVWAALLLAAAAAAPAHGTGVVTVVLGCSVLWLVVPAAVTAWRSSDVSGVAWGTWALLVVNGLVTGAYGLVASVPANLVFAAAATVGGGAVLLRIGGLPYLRFGGLRTCAQVRAPEVWRCTSRDARGDDHDRPGDTSRTSDARAGTATAQTSVAVAPDRAVERRAPVERGEPVGRARRRQPHGRPARRAAHVVGGRLRRRAVR